VSAKREVLTASSAYEISTFHKREPPPKEILEDVSAKGGDLLNRTLENYLPRSSREADNLANGDRSDSEDEQNTPRAGDRMDIDEPGSTGGRATRGKREARGLKVLLLQGGEHVVWKACLPERGCFATSERGAPL
jgi:chromatin structure-remodeling complex subunit RSC9